jgi:ABC-2 type transport system ATP-binding protein
MDNGLMIEVADLVKDYASHRALHNLTFNVRRGEIVGLLGRNGAGKSSTMRILSCYMPATSGRHGWGALTFFQRRTRFAGK